jgi:hypothetical protein
MLYGLCYKPYRTALILAEKALFTSPLTCDALKVCGYDKTIHRGCLKQFVTRKWKAGNVNYQSRIAIITCNLRFTHVDDACSRHRIAVASKPLRIAPSMASSGEDKEGTLKLMLSKRCGLLLQCE